MHFIYQSLIKTLEDFIHFKIIYNNKFLFNARLNKTFKKDFNKIFVFIIETNATNSIIAKL